MRRVAVAVVLIGFGLAGAPGAWATTTTVGCSGLQSALNSAASGDVVKLTGLCPAQSFTITNTNAFTLEGVGNGSGGTPSSGFNGVLNSTSPQLSSSQPVQLKIENLLFENASTTGGGSAINIGSYSSPYEAVTIKNDTFTGNAGTGGSAGGAVAINTSNGSGSATPTVITGNRFSGNISADGGAIYFSSGAPLQLTHNTFTGNSTDSTSTYYPVGGAVDIENYEGPPYMGSPITVSGNTFGGTGAGQGNTAKGAGGALFVAVQGGEGAGEPAQTVTMTKNKFLDNQVTGGVNFNLYGGAVGMAPQLREFSFKVVQSGNLFQGNHITGTVNSDYGAGGGAEWGIGIPIKSTRDKFISNQVNVTGATTIPPLGGAVGIISTNQYIGTSSSTTLLRASFTGADDLFRGNSDPSANGWGGAIYTGGVSTVNCSSPTACPSTLALYDSTIVHNRVPSSGGQGAAIWGGPADSLALKNSIVYGNRGPAGAPEIYGYSKPKYSYDDACTVAAGKTALTGKGDICANPKLTPLGAETATSPTIDRGSNALVPKGLKTDLVGRRRITEGRPTTCKPVVDMGAYESKAVKPAPACLPVNVKKPQISGKPGLGHILTCLHGSWTHQPTRFLYGWSRNGKTIKGATKNTYKVTGADKSHSLACTVKAVNSAGTSKPATSAAVHVT